MLQKLTDAVEAARIVAVVAGEGLDADAVGAAAALTRVIGLRWPGKAVSVVLGEQVPRTCAFLMDGVASTAVDRPDAVDLAIILDGGVERAGAAKTVLERAGARAQVDHHRSARGQGVDVALIDPDAASTTQIVARLADAWGVALDARLAEAIYAGLVFDTGAFRYAMTSPETLRLAGRCLEAGIDHARIVERVLLEQPVERLRLKGIVAARAQVEANVAWSWVGADERRGVDLGGLVDELVFLEGVEVGVLVAGKPGGRAKVSMRSRGGVDVASVAAALSATGGGHLRAAGATVDGEPEAVARRVAALVHTQAVSPR